MRRRRFACEKICVVGMALGGNGPENKNHVCDYLYRWIRIFILVDFLENVFIFYFFLFLESEDQEGNRELVKLWGKTSRVTNMQIKRRRRMLKPARR